MSYFYTEEEEEDRLWYENQTMSFIKERYNHFNHTLQKRYCVRLFSPFLSIIDEIVSL